MSTVPPPVFGTTVILSLTHAYQQEVLHMLAVAPKSCHRESDNLGSYSGDYTLSLRLVRWHSFEFIISDALFLRLLALILRLLVFLLQLLALLLHLLAHLLVLLPVLLLAVRRAVLHRLALRAPKQGVSGLSRSSAALEAALLLRLRL